MSLNLKKGGGMKDYQTVAKLLEEYGKMYKNVLRLGQFICNRLNITDEILFYEKSNQAALLYYMSNYYGDILKDDINET